jgi:hypothetical protein
MAARWRTKNTRASCPSSLCPVSGVEAKAFRRLFLASAYSRKNSRLKSRLLLPAFAPIGTASASVASVSEERCFFVEAALFLFLLSLPCRR